jgi:hypothetical protein
VLPANRHARRFAIAAQDAILPYKKLIMVQFPPLFIFVLEILVNSGGPSVLCALVRCPRGFRIH